MANEKDTFGTPDADGWYEWKGDEMIRPAGLVNVKLRGFPWAEPLIDLASNFDWAHDSPCNLDIVKWRPAQ